MIDTIANGLDHPECVAVGPDGRIYAGGEAGQLYLVDAASGSVAEIGTTGGWLLGLAVDAAHQVYACDPKLRSLVTFGTDGSFGVLSRGTTERPMVNPNFPVFDSGGMLYVSDSGTWPAGGGCIYRITPDGSTSVWSEAAPQFTNGLAIDPTGSYLYVVESTLPGVTRIRLDGGATSGPAETVVLMPGTVPDGIAFDQEGRLFISCYRPDRIYTLEPDGRLLILRDDYQGTDLAAPTNVAFGGEDGKDLYIASLGRWHIARIRVDVPGAPLHYPSGPSLSGSSG